MFYSSAPEDGYSFDDHKLCIAFEIYNAVIKICP